MSSFVETKIESIGTNQSKNSLSPEEYQSLFERLELDAESAREDERRQAHARAWELAKQQGVKPIRSIEDLQGDFWPEEESVDGFLEWVRAIRQQDRQEPRSE